MLLFLMFHRGGLFGQIEKSNKIDRAYEYLRQRGEVEISFNLPSREMIKSISNIISIENVDGNRVFGTTNEKNFNRFLELGLDFEVIDPVFPESLRMSKNLDELQDWQTYPTFEQYDSLMKKFVDDYPELCWLDTIGYSEEGRNILFVKISDNVNEKEAEREFMFTSTMHGNETAGFILMLRYIDYLLKNYETDSLVTRLVNGIEIWINPLSNPDGLYAGGNHTISGAIRYNTNGVDLNRNFPDPADGPHPDGNDYQAETLVMMDFMEKHNFILSANFHSGAEVVNYPWDTWQTYDEDKPTFHSPHPDDNWLQLVSKEYADTAQFFSPAGYFTNPASSGFILGGDWYMINGGRQDYVTCFLHGREVTIELDNTKITPEPELENLWNYNYRSFLNYTKQCLYGIRGIITDSITGHRLKAKIEILDHDMDSSHVYSDSTWGNYHRLIYEGAYNLRFSAPGYHEKYIDSIIVENRKATELDVQLVPLNHANIFRKYPVQFKLSMYPNPATSFIYLSFELPNPSGVAVELLDIAGNKVSRIGSQKYPSGQNRITLDLSKLSKGVYVIRLITDSGIIDKKVIKL